jgi:predicted esterase YcpF (UPF0227 family)
MEYSTIYLLHGLGGGSPNGSVSLLQKALEPVFPNSEFIRPLLPHANRNIENPEESIKFLEDLNIPNGSLVIGISLGGLVAAKLQEQSRPDLNIICLISAPRFKTIELKKKMPNRVAFYSSNDKVIADRVSSWAEFAESHDLPWLEHDIDPHIPELVKLIEEYLRRN